MQLAGMTADMMKALGADGPMNRKEAAAACLQIQQTLNRLTHGL